MKLYMKQFVLLLAATCSRSAFQATRSEAARWKQQAANVTIVRDDWGIAHVYGKTDADAVFGMMYAQAEDDFNRVETNYINAMGRLAEAEGESKIYQDLRMKLFIDPDGAEEPIRGQPGVVEDADERLRRRPELLPLQASRGEAASHPALRALDGAFLHRGQHRRRHRAREPQSAPGVLRQGSRRARRSIGIRRTNRRSRAGRTAWRSRRRTPPRITPCC